MHVWLAKLDGEVCHPGTGACCQGASSRCDNCTTINLFVADHGSDNDHPALSLGQHVGVTLVRPECIRPALLLHLILTEVLVSLSRKIVCNTGHGGLGRGLTVQLSSKLLWRQAAVLLALCCLLSSLVFRRF
jgi:hypothetical protein